MLAGQHTSADHSSAAQQERPAQEVDSSGQGRSARQGSSTQQGTTTGPNTQAEAETHAAADASDEAQAVQEEEDSAASTPATDSNSPQGLHQHPQQAQHEPRAQAHAGGDYMREFLPEASDGIAEDSPNSRPEADGNSHQATDQHRRQPLHEPVAQAHAGGDYMREFLPEASDEAQDSTVPSSASAQPLSYPQLQQQPYPHTVADRGPSREVTVSAAVEAESASEPHSHALPEHQHQPRHEPVALAHAGGDYMREFLPEASDETEDSDVPHPQSDASLQLESGSKSHSGASAQTESRPDAHSAASAQLESTTEHHSDASPHLESRAEPCSDASAQLDARAEPNSDTHIEPESTPELLFQAELLVAAADIKDSNRIASSSAAEPHSGAAAEPESAQELLFQAELLAAAEHGQGSENTEDSGLAEPHSRGAAVPESTQELLFQAELLAAAEEGQDSTEQSGPAIQGRPAEAEARQSTTSAISRDQQSVQQPTPAEAARHQLSAGAAHLFPLPCCFALEENHQFAYASMPVLCHVHCSARCCWCATFSVHLCCNNCE